MIHCIDFDFQGNVYKGYEDIQLYKKEREDSYQKGYDIIDAHFISIPFLFFQYFLPQIVNARDFTRSAMKLNKDSIRTKL